MKDSILKKIVDIFWDKNSNTSLINKFLFISFIDAVGTGIYLACSTIYFSLILHISNDVIGISLTIASILGLIALPYFGKFADKYNSKIVLITLHLWRFFAFTGVALSFNFISFLISIMAVGLSQQALNPIYQAYIEEVLGVEGRVSVMAKVRVVYNIGFSIGGLLTTSALALSSNGIIYKIILLVNAISCLIAAVLLMSLKSTTFSHNRYSNSNQEVGKVHAKKDMYFMLISGINGIFSFHSTILSVGIPLWIVIVGLNPALAGIMFTLNTIIAVLFQVAVTKKAKTFEGGVKSLIIGGITLIISCIAFSVSIFESKIIAIFLITIGIVFLTIAEMFQSAGGWTISYDLSPENNRAEYLSLFNMGTSIQSVIGPAIVTTFVITKGIKGWIGCIIVLVVCLFLLKPSIKKYTERKVN